MSHPVALYRVQVRHPETATHVRASLRGEWSWPLFGPKAVKSSLPTARAALTRYRNAAKRLHEDRRPEFRLVRIVGEWQAVPGE